jgi:hypothetical protein
MKPVLLESGDTTLGIGEDGFLDPIVFGRLQPMHSAPWLLETHTNLPPMLRRLRGDFFCAPFGESDLLPEERRPHGTSANGQWRIVAHTRQHARLELETSIMGATLYKEVFVQNGVIYQSHRFVGGRGRIPVGHHAMLQTQQPLQLSFSPFVFGATPPTPLEPDPALGHSSLRYPQEFSRLEAVQNANGSSVDLSFYPHSPRSEDLVQLVSSLASHVAWSAAHNPQANWLWVGFKNPKQLQSTLLWQSNGGRFYPPFSNRHLGVLGIEEVTAYFHLGHRAALENSFLERGIATFIDLETNPQIGYAMTCVAVPEGFGGLDSVETQADELVLVGRSGKVVKLPFLLGWLA